MRTAWVLVLLAAVGCKRISTGAKEHFAERRSCPEANVEIVARPDLKWGTIRLAKQTPSVPSDEVKKDPARLAKWTADQAAQNAQAKAYYDDRDVYEGKGCGHDDLMACYHPTPRAGNTDTSLVTCDDAPE